MTSVSFSGVKAVRVEYVASNRFNPGANWWKVHVDRHDGSHSDVLLFGEWRGMDKPFTSIEWTLPSELALVCGPQAVEGAL